MTGDIILKPALEVFLKFKTDTRKGMGERRRREILNFPFILVFFTWGGLLIESRRKRNSEKKIFSLTVRL